MQTLWEDRPPAPGSASRIKITCHLERSPGSRSVELLFLICLIYHSISGKSFKLDTTCGLWPIVSFLKTVVKYTWQTLPASSSLRAQFGGTKYIHIAVQPSPPSVSRASLSSQPATLSPLKTLTTQPLPPVPGTHHLLSVSVRLTPLGTSYGWNHIVFVLLWAYHNVLKIHPSCSMCQNRKDYPKEVTWVKKKKYSYQTLVLP